VTNKKAPSSKKPSQLADFENNHHTQLLELAEYRMPFGKYTGTKLVDLPEPYVIWFAQQGFPNGKLGRLMKIVYEIKVNGLEYLFDKIP